jgi:hypothetical protein
MVVVATLESSDGPISLNDLFYRVGPTLFLGLTPFILSFTDVIHKLLVSLF